MRNNINGDFKKVENLIDLLPGSFVNINWKDRNLMLPYSPRKGFISFSDLKWDFRYRFNESGEVNENETILYEIISRDENIEHICKSLPKDIS